FSLRFRLRLIMAPEQIQVRPVISPSVCYEDFQSSCRSGTMCHFGRYWYLFKRLTAVSAGQFYRFEHIAADSSFKTLAKQRERLDQSPIDRLAASLYPYTEGQTFEKEERS